MRFLADGEAPLPLHPMNERTRAWLKASGFRDNGISKGKRLFRHPDMMPRVILMLHPEMTVAEVLSHIWTLGQDAQAESSREAVRRLFATFRRGEALPERELTDLLVPSASPPAEPPSEMDWEGYHHEDEHERRQKHR